MHENVEARGRMVSALVCEAEGRWFESYSGQWLENSLCSPAVKWVPDLIQGRKGSGRRGMGSAFHMLFPRHGEPLTVRRPNGQ